MAVAAPVGMEILSGGYDFPLLACSTPTVEWTPFRLTGQESLATRASRKLRNDELLVTGLAGTRFRLEIDKAPLWRGDHVSIRQLVEDFACYTYLPRLRDPSVLVNAIREGIGLLTWPQDSFAYAESFDESAGRYLALRAGQNVPISEDSLIGLLVKPEIARNQLDAASAVSGGGASPSTGTQLSHGGADSSDTTIQQPGGAVSPAISKKQPKRFHGTVRLDENRAGRDASTIASEVLAHLVGLVGSDVTVTLEIEARLPDGVPESVVRTVTENCRTLKFTSQGFESE